MGEGILKQLVAARQDAGQWHIESAGTWADHGCPPATLSQLVMKMRGINISSHLSQPVDEELIRQFDLILTMENHHKEGLRYAFKEHSDRIFMISEMVGLEENISDPIGGDVDDYEETAIKLEQMFSDGLDRIYRQAKNSRNDHPPSFLERS
jgi:protein-tyrosine-phosphatase